MALGIICLLSGLIVSVVAAYFSITGLTAIFSHAVIPIIVMGVALEQAKLVAAVWLHRYWSGVSAYGIKVYLALAVVVLILITSLGCFGYLARAHLDAKTSGIDEKAQIESIDAQIATLQYSIDADKNTLSQIDGSFDRYVELGAVTKGLKQRDELSQERKSLLDNIAANNARILELQLEKAKSSASVARIEAELGPIKYLAEMVYGSSYESHADSTVRAVIILIVFVFDPLAVMLLLASQVAFKHHRDRKPSIDESDEPESVEPEADMPDNKRKVKNKFLMTTR